MTKITLPRAAILLIVMIVVTLALHYFRNDTDEKPANPVVGMVQSDHVDGIGSAEKTKPAKNTGAKATPVEVDYVLPSYDTPFDETFAGLKSASDKGEARATCLLSIELFRCQVMSIIDEKLVSQMMKEPPPDFMTEAEKQAFDQFNLVQYEAFMACKKIPPDLASNAAGYLEKAARQKQVDAMVLWASGAWIQNWHSHDAAYLQTPAFAHWRTSAAPLMTEALKAGSYGAALEWLLAYTSDRSTPFSRLVKDDDKQAYTFSVLIKLLENSSVAAGTRPGLSARDTVQAEHNAKQMFEKWFHRKPPARGISSSNFGPGVEACGSLVN